MQNYISFVKQSLSEFIKDMSKVPWLFVKNPESDFSRKRKLDFDTFFHFFIAMEGCSLGTELLDHFDFSPETVSVSAFNQQRSKILVYRSCNATQNMEKLPPFSMRRL